MNNMNGIEDQRLPLLESSGLETGGRFVPRFQVGVGQSVCLHVEHQPEFPWYDWILPLLKGDVEHPAIGRRGVHFYMRAASADRGWFGRLKGTTALDWLVKRQGVPLHEAERILKLVDAPPNIRVNWLPLNERMTIALEACLVHPPDLLLFDTFGCAAYTVQSLFDRLATRPSQLALAYLKTNLNYDDYPCLPGAACHVIADLNHQPTAVE